MNHYSNAPEGEWAAITRSLVTDHSLPLENIKKLVLQSWSNVWKIGCKTDNFSINFRELGFPAQVVSSCFESILLKALSEQYPDTWRSGGAHEKDAHNLENDAMSFELKMSGQLGFKVFGNRSYAYAADEKNNAKIKKSRNGYYLIVNYFEEHITLIRFGWIDAQDWEAQKSQSGQMARLLPHVYDHKLITIDGKYRLNAPVALVMGVGQKAASTLNNLGIFTVEDLLRCDSNSKALISQRKAAFSEYGHLLD